MSTLIIILHVVVCFALILIVLLQTGKGATMGAAFGGGSSQTVFGSRGPTNFMHKITAAAAVIFMVTSLGLTIFSAKPTVNTSVMDGDADKKPPVTSTTAPKKEAPVPGGAQKDETKPPSPAGE